MGRRWGKTVLGTHRLIGPALEGFPVAWFAPSYKYLAEAWRDFERALKPIIRRSSETQRRIELVTGGTIEFWSCEDPDAGRSRKYKRIAVDEAAKVKGLEKAWNEAIRPTLTDLIGDADFYSTPKGHDFFWKAFTWGQDQSKEDWACWQLPTSTNPHIDADEIEAARRQLPERVFEQEFLALFLDSSGGVFRNVTESIDRGRTVATGPIAGHRYSTGVDLARVEDFTVITTLDAKGVQVYHERFNQISWERQIAAIKAILALYPGTAVLDSTGVGDPIYESLRKSGCNVLGYQFTNASKTELIDGLALALERGNLRLLDMAEQENELKAFEYTLTPSRNVTMSAPEGMHDDCVIALALARWAQGKPKLPLIMRL
jgi:terminase large subunit-like protein